MKKWTKLELEGVKKLLEEGKTFAEIADVLGRSHNSVTSKLRKIGLKSSYNKTSDWTKKELRKAKIILSEGGSYLDISKELNKDHGLVDYYLRKRGYMSGYQSGKKKRKSKYESFNWVEIQNFYDKGASYSRLVKEKGLTPTAIKWGQDNGKLKTRTIKEGVRVYLDNNPRKSNEKDIKLYRLLCGFKFNVYDYPNNFNLSLIEEKGWYKAKNRGDNPNGISRDHMVSVSFGFKNGILPYYISHPVNCRLMAHNQNNKKNSECSIAFEELIKRVDEWDNKK